MDGHNIYTFVIWQVDLYTHIEKTTSGFNHYFVWVWEGIFIRRLFVIVTSEDKGL